MALSGAPLEEVVERMDRRLDEILTILTSALPKQAEQRLYVTQSMIDASVSKELTALDLRHRIFPKIAHKQIPWVLLLVAYKHTSEGKLLSVTNLMSWSHSPSTTSLKHINRLEEAGLLNGEVDVNDARRRWIASSAETERLMKRYFTALQTI